jgi:hypothetical protein
MSHSFFPKDVKRHWTAGLSLVQDLSKQFGADAAEFERHIKVKFPNGRMIRYTFLDLQFNSLEQFKHDMAKAAKGEQWQ